MDFEGIGLADIPVSALKNFVASSQRNFRGRMYRNIMLNTHWLVQGLWATIKGWLDPFVQQKIIMCSEEDMKSTMSQYIDLKDVEEQYGGSKPRITANFYPPKY